MSDTRYNLRGVSAGKEDVHNAIKHVDKGLYPQAFCKIVPDHLSGDEDYCIVMHADGAGTKSALAYMYWKETGDLSVWKGIAQDALIMNIDDLLCVGATDKIMLSSTIGRNKNLIPGEVISAIINGTEELLEELDRRRTRWNTIPYNKKKTCSYELDEYFCGTEGRYDEEDEN
jgi:phosphoribosylformylglycinamidine cyclo-ligase